MATGPKQRDPAVTRRTPQATTVEDYFQIKYSDLVLSADGQLLFTGTDTYQEVRDLGELHAALGALPVTGAPNELRALSIEDAEDVNRLMRILRQPRGHALLLTDQGTVQLGFIRQVCPPIAQPRSGRSASVAVTWTPHFQGFHPGPHLNLASEGPGRGKTPGPFLSVAQNF